MGHWFESGRDHQIQGEQLASIKKLNLGNENYMINTVEFKNAVETVLPTNHVFVADVSYSMYNVLPKIRQHLKDNLARLVKPEDTVSILYFSSRGQYGSVFVGEKVNTIEDLTNIHKAIDRFLKPTGCTGFVEPLKLASDVAMDLRHNGNLASLVFMTDGYDNCWTEQDILKACNQLPMAFNNILFLEYGWYCNRPLLEKMSEATNAMHTFVESYDDFETEFDLSMSRHNAKRIEINATGAEHAIYLENGKLNIVNVVNDVALIPENVSQVWLMNVENDTVPPQSTPCQELFVALYYAIHRMQPDMAWNILRALGDVRIAKMYQSCFTKQDYSNVKDAVMGCVNDESQRFMQGCDFNVVPDDNAPTLLDVIQVLLDHNAEIDIKSPDFSYNRTGRASVQKDDTTIADLSEQIANASSSEERKELARKLALHEEWKPVFTSTAKTASMNNVVFNSSRPNISINTVQQGFVSVPENVQAAHTLPAKIESKIYRNYTLVRDGILNMKELPVKIDYDALIKLSDFGVKFGHYLSINAPGREHIKLDLTSVPLVNRAMTKNLSGKEFAEAHVSLLSKKAHQKVLKHFRDQLGGKTNAKGLADQYGAEAAAYLSEQGIRDYGFSPKSVRAESTDFYMSKELNVKIKGASSLPAISAVEKKIVGGKKLNVADQLINEALVTYTDILQDLSVAEQSAFIEVRTKRIIDEVRALEKNLSKIMYGVVVAHRWFEDVDFEEPTVVVSHSILRQPVDFTVTFALEEKQIKI